MKKILKIVWNEFIYGGHLVALGSSIIAYSISFINKIEASWQLLLSAYLITYIIHMLDRYSDIKNESSTERKKHLEKYTNILPPIIALTFICSIVLLAQKGILISIIGIIILFLGLLYGVFFKKITRYIVGFKSYFTAFAFASAALFSAYYYNLKINSSILLIFSFFALRWFCNTIFCDLKDYDQDKRDNLKTFTVYWGKEKVYIFFYFCNVASIIPIIIGIYKDLLPAYLIFLVLIIFYYFYYLRLSKKMNANYQILSNVWADGESVVWLLLLFGGRLLWAS